MTTLKKDLYTTTEVATYLTISKLQVRRLVEQGRLKLIRLSPMRVVYTREAILDYLASCEEASL